MRWYSKASLGLCFFIGVASAQTLGPPGGSSSGGTTSVSNADGTLVISPTTGAVVASLNPTQPNSVLFPAGSAPTPGIGIGIAGTGLYSVSTTGLCFADVNGTCRGDYGITTASVLTASEAFTATGNISGPAFISTGNVTVGAGGRLLWGGRTTLTSASDGVLSISNNALTNNLAISVPVSNTLQFGSLDAAAPAAQFLFFQSVVAGTSNAAGANATLRGSLSTGSGASGDLVVQTGGTGAAATVQNTAVTAMTIKGATQQVQLSNSLQLASISACTTPTGANGNFCVIRGSSGAGFCTFEVVTTTNTQIIAANVPGGC